ncbi:MAG TPA: AMP-binding protein, partial [Gammaproteobacteria bacterium]
HLRGWPDRINAAEALLGGALAAGHGPRDAFHFLDGSWSFAELHDRVERIARVLVDDFGLVPGDRVLLRSRNTPMLAACWLAVLKAGGICVTTMPLLRAGELGFILERVRVRFALAELDLADELEKAHAGCAGLERVALFTPLGDGRREDADLDRRANAAEPWRGWVATAADDIALITFTSGSTGRPKAAAQFHRDILASAVSMPQVFPVRRDEVICGSPTMAFTFGLSSFLLFPLRYGAAAALVPAPTAEHILEAMERRRVTSLYAVPTCYRSLLPWLERHDLSALRSCASAGEHLQPALWQEWLERTGIRIANGVGATEFMSHFLAEIPAVERPGSAGRVVPGYSARIIDDQGRPLPAGETGLIAVRGPTGCRYLDDPERQRLFVRDGWNVTNDLFRVDDDGFFWFADRADDMIVSSGYNISPQEVERVIVQHPAVAQCAVVGVPDPVRGKLVRACVVLKDGELGDDAMRRSIQSFVKDSVAPYKYPRDVQFYIDLPKTPTGKIQRFRLREGEPETATAQPDGSCCR